MGSGSDAVLLGMGNPLLDISAKVDAAFLDKYGLEPANAILAEEKHQPMYADLSTKPGVVYIAGGATQNSIRVAQALLTKGGKKNSTAYLGAVGKDEYAAKMKAACAEDGVNATYMEVDQPTGTCGVCVVDKDRSLVANLSAANEYKISHTEANWSIVEKAQFIYSAGFFITVAPDAMKKVWEHCAAEKKTYCLNLAAPFILQVPPFKKVVNEAIPYVDYLFGNETEAVEFAKSEGWDTTDVAEIARKLSLFPSADGKPSRTVVFTQGTSPTIIAKDGKSNEFPIEKLPAEKVVDTNGAGDAYVGGFLSELVKGSPMADCHEKGAYAAKIIVQQDGCTFPEGGL